MRRGAPARPCARGRPRRRAQRSAETSRGSAAGAAWIFAETIRDDLSGRALAGLGRGVGNRGPRRRDRQSLLEPRRRARVDGRPDQRDVHVENLLGAAVRESRFVRPRAAEADVVRPRAAEADLGAEAIGGDDRSDTCAELALQAVALRVCRKVREVDVVRALVGNEPRRRDDVVRGRALFHFDDEQLLHQPLRVSRDVPPFGGRHGVVRAPRPRAYLRARDPSRPNIDAAGRGVVATRLHGIAAAAPLPASIYTPVARTSLSDLAKKGRCPESMT